jgi:hypothetical protein
MLYHARNWPAVAQCLPMEPREVEKLPRAYLANVIYTVVGDLFKQWVDGEISKRNAKIVEDQNLAINMDPEIYAAFKASNHVSVQHGASGHLMKASASRRRTKADIEEEKLAASAKEQEIQQKLQMWDQMEQQVQKSEQKAEKLRRQSESMSQIYMDGLIKKNDAGLFELVQDPSEAQELQEKRSKPKRRGNIDPHQMQLDDVDLDIQEGDLE